jgi:sporulation protein YlmC with PRC-barrel domain
LEDAVVTTKFLSRKGGLVDSTMLVGAKVENAKGENLGKIENLVLDLDESRILYAVLSFGGFLGLGDKLFPIPLESLVFHTNEKGKLERCILNVDKEMLKNAPGYDKDTLPNSADRTFAGSVYQHYGTPAYWSE